MKVYDPKSIVISLGGVIIGRGFAPESMVKVTQTSALYEDEVGVDGECTRVRLYDSRATVAIMLMQSSESNDLLMSYLLRDMNAPNGLGVGAFVLQDLGGTTLVKSPAAWVKGKPESEWGKKVGQRPWDIALASNDQSFIGGSASV